jgi:hypothetical protein
MGKCWERGISEIEHVKNKAEKAKNAGKEGNKKGNKE